MDTKKPLIYIIAGKARSGKDEVAKVIKDYYEELGQKVLNLQYSFYIKEYVKKISGWDGSEEEKPRELLQTVGTDIIRKRIDDLFFIKRICDDILVYSYFFDVITISDTRYKKEIEIPKSKFEGLKSIHLVRPGFDNGLTNNEIKHATEIDLDNYNRFDYEIINDGNLEDLKDKVIEVLK